MAHNSENVEGAPTARPPWLAMSLSLMFAGVGQIYTGARVAGMFIIFAYAALIAGASMVIFAHPERLILCSFLYLAVSLVLVAAIGDAYRRARKWNSLHGALPEKQVKDPWLAFFLSLVFPGAGQFYKRRWVVGAIAVVAFLIPFAAPMPGAMRDALAGIVYVAAACHAYSAQPLAARRNLPLAFLIAAATVASLTLFGEMFQVILRTLLHNIGLDELLR